MNNTHKTCLLCGSDKLKEMTGYEKYFLVKCKKCRFVFTARIPSNEELSKYYSSWNRNKYLSPITIKRYRELLDSFEPYRKNNRILDIGCGNGDFLAEAVAKGWEAYGTEYTDEAIALTKSKGIHAMQGELNPENYEEGFFDVITSFEVIEHINTPQNEAENIKQILRSGGLFYLTTPNFNSYSRIRAKAAWDNIHYPEHLSYYSAKTLNYVFRKNGFSKKKILTTGISLTRMKMAKSKKSGDKVSQNEKIHTAKSSDEKFRTLAEEKAHYKLIKKTVNLALTIFRKGDTLKGYFIRKA